MRPKESFSKKDIAVILFCVVFLLTGLGAVDNRGYERAKRLVCLSNLKQLTLAWIMFADDNEGKLPNSDVGFSGSPPVRTWWVNWPRSLYEMEQWYEAIKAGQLWSYCKNVKLYRCPSAPKQYGLSYAIVDSMNGYCGWSPETVELKITHINQIRKPAERIVFLDESPPTPGTWGIKYTEEDWWDPAL